MTGTTEQFKSCSKEDKLLERHKDTPQSNVSGASEAGGEPEGIGEAAMGSVI